MFNCFSVPFLPFLLLLRLSYFFQKKHYIADPSNPEWLPRLPMTKASVRAMDAASAFWEAQSGNIISGWIVAGASKRGWTTWTVGACVPERVIAIVPLVLDELNFVKDISHHFRAVSAAERGRVGGGGHGWIHLSWFGEKAAHTRKGELR